MVKLSFYACCLVNQALNCGHKRTIVNHSPQADRQRGHECCWSKQDLNCAHHCLLLVITDIWVPVTCVFRWSRCNVVWGHYSLLLATTIEAQRRRLLADMYVCGFLGWCFHLIPLKLWPAISYACLCESIAVDAMRPLQWEVYPPSCRWCHAITVVRSAGIENHCWHHWLSIGWYSSGESTIAAMATNSYPKIHRRGPRLPIDCSPSPVMTANAIDKWLAHIFWW